jgi:hypothetical protein
MSVLSWQKGMRDRLDFRGGAPAENIFREMIARRSDGGWWYKVASPSDFRPP